MKNINKNAIIKIIKASRGSLSFINSVMYITDDISSSGVIETVLIEDWLSYKDKPLSDLLFVYGNDLDEFIRELELIYSLSDSDIKSSPFNSNYNYIDSICSNNIVYKAKVLGWPIIENDTTNSLRSKLIEHGYSIIITKANNDNSYIGIKKDGDNRLLIF